MDHHCIHLDNYKWGYDLRFGIVREGHMYQGKDLCTVDSCKIYPGHNLSWLHIQDDNLVVNQYNW